MINHKKYPIPPFLKKYCKEDAFDKWLERKARTHIKRDRKKRKNVKRELYKAAIYAAIKKSRGKDAYTGKVLRWDLINKYSDDKSKRRGQEYKKELGDLPTLDHAGSKDGKSIFNICSWRINSCKCDLSLSEFRKVCKDVLLHGQLNR